MIPIPPLNLSGGGASGRTETSASVGLNTANPFNFDNSGWVVNIGSSGVDVSASGNGGNQTPISSGGAMKLPKNVWLIAGIVIAAVVIWRR